MISYINNINQYFEKLKNVINKLDINEINQFINILCYTREEGKNIFIMGNGGSAATASHFCCDFNKGVNTIIKNQKRFKFICLNDNIATVMAYANDLSYIDIFKEQLKNFLAPRDVVIGISGSGNSENIIKAINYANDNNGITIALTGFNGGILKKIAQYSVHVNVDDMQIVEDLHMVFDHLCMKIITNSLY